MDSHIQMPESVLKHFSIQTGVNKGKIYYYTFETKNITLGSPKILNTKENYYSNEVEKYFSDEVETPLGKVIKHLKDSFYEGKGFKFNQKVIDIIFNYLYALLARSPQMTENVRKSLLLNCFFSEQNIHDMSAIDAIKLMQQDQLFKDEFFPNFVLNKTDIPFVLPTCGYYDYKLGDDEKEIIQIPLTENICISFFKINRLKNNKIDNKPSVFWVDGETVQKMNNQAFESQKRYQNAYLVSSDRNELERIQKVMENESV